jgi:tetratricopeptide (TPR) repeat protein
VYQYTRSQSDGLSVSSIAGADRDFVAELSRGCYTVAIGGDGSLNVRRFLAIILVIGCAAQDGPAEKLIASGHWKRARALIEQRLHAKPDDPEALFMLSQIRNAFGDHSSPLGLAEKAVLLNGSVARYHRQLAEVQGIMAQHAGPLQEIMLGRRFRKEIDIALKLDPRDVQAHRDLLEFYLLAPGILGGEVKKAEITAQQISALDAAEGYLAKARIAEIRKDRGQTALFLREAAAVRPASYKAQVALGQMYLDQSPPDVDSAEKFARTAVSVDAERVAGYAILAAVYADRSDWSALDRTLVAAAQAVPDDPTPYYRAAERLLTADREPARAERYLRTYLAQEPEGNQPTAADAHWKLGLALRAQSEVSAAVSEWKKALALNPASPAGIELKQIRNATPNSREAN